MAIVVWDRFSPLAAAAVTLADLTLLAVVVRLLWALNVNRELVAEREREASTDVVTELANHRALTQVLKAEIDRSRRYERSLSILFVDLDYFKSVNDDHGHEAGDRTLREFGQVVSGSLREIDTLGRWGGEEFVIVLPETEGRQAVRDGGACARAGCRSPVRCDCRSHADVLNRRRRDGGAGHRLRRTAEPCRRGYVQGQVCGPEPGRCSERIDCSATPACAPAAAGPVAGSRVSGPDSPESIGGEVELIGQPHGRRSRVPAEVTGEPSRARSARE